MDENVLVDLYLLGSDVGPLRSLGLEATSVSKRCFGRDWNRRESEEKALLGKVAGGPPARMCSSYLLGPDVGPFGFKDEKKLLSV